MNKLFFGVLVSILVAYGSADGVGWRRIGSKYYYFERTEEVTWFKALGICREMGGHLANIENKKEFDAIEVKLDAGKDYWIDINDLSEEGVYRSETTGREATYGKWHENEPNDGDDSDYHEDCVELWYYDNMHLMNDVHCQEEKFFICED